MRIRNDKRRIITVVITAVIIGISYLYADNTQVKNKHTEPTKATDLSSVHIVFTQVTVTRVVDGDTIVVELLDGSSEKVRLIGINTPETVKPNSAVEHYGKEASNYTKSMLSGKTIYLEKDVGDRDKYGRLLRYVWIEIPQKINEQEIRQKMFNAILVIDGYAQLMTMPPDVKYANYFKKFQRDSRERNKGLWK